MKRYLLLVVLTLVALEGASAVALFGLSRVAHLRYEPIRTALPASQRDAIERLLRGESRYIGLDPELGWSILPNGEPPDGLYRANSQGIRADREYSLEPPRGVLRIAAFGESFTHGSEVRNPDAWTAQLEAARSNLEVLNFGVPGYGTDQAWLRYQRDGVPFRPHVVLIGYMPENIHRNVSAFRPFYHPQSAYPFSKPRFRLEGDRLALVPNALTTLDDYRELLARERQVLPRLARWDYFYERFPHAGPEDLLSTVRLGKLFVSTAKQRNDPRRIKIGDRYNTASEAYRVTLRVLEGFYREVERRHSLPVLVILPDQGDAVGACRVGHREYQPLLEELAPRGLRVLDVSPAFCEAPELETIEDGFLGKWQHYSPNGNAVVARAVSEWLEQLPELRDKRLLAR